MQDLSYSIQNPVFSFHGLRFSLQVFTFENVYALDKDRCTISGDEQRCVIHAARFTWAGGQERMEGSVDLCVEQIDGASRFTISATCPLTIRSVKLVLHDLPDGHVINLRETPAKAIPAQGLILHYPEGWRNLYTPLVIFKTADHYRYFRSLDAQVRDKKFVFVRRGNALDVELIFEQLATQASASVQIPAWEVGISADPDALMNAQQAHVAEAYQLKRWEERDDVPDWMHKIALVAAIHCQHYSGYIFNDYAKVLENARWLTQHLNGEHILIYLPGWEGRYYWQYGDYRPDPRMGGEAGFERMVQGLHELGVHVMPMFGANVVNKGMPNFEQWGASAVATSPTGMKGGSTVDWDGSRHYDHGWGAFLNVGAPAWQNRLVDQIHRLVDRYRFDAVFLDISAGWMNDPLHDMYQGTRQLVQRIRQQHPELLIAGEGWYDAVGSVTPLMQNGHTDGEMHPHDNVFPSFFDTYHRAFGHLCLGDPGRGSTGVHELGTNPTWREPLRKGIIPTVTLVEDTLFVAEDKVRVILEDARLYLQRYLM